MNSKIRTLINFVFLFIFFFYLASFPVHAGNSPDSNKSSLSVNSSSIPADGQTTGTISISLKDSSGNVLNGDTVNLSIPNGVSISPSSTTLDSSGNATFTVTSNNTGTDNIDVVDTTTSTTLSNLGQVTFGAAISPTPTTSQNCTDSSPATPTLVSATALGPHQIVLTWNQAADPVSYYLVSFGLKSGDYQYGDPNVGKQGTTSYTVNSLSSGTKYYFVVKAVNGCMPGSYSNEISAVAGTAQAAAIKLAATPTDVSDSPEPTDEPIATDTPADSPTPTPLPSHLPFSINTIILGGTVIGGIMILIVTVGFLKKKRS